MDGLHWHFQYAWQGNFGAPKNVIEKKRFLCVGFSIFFSLYLVYRLFVGFRLYSHCVVSVVGSSSCCQVGLLVCRGNPIDIRWDTKNVLGQSIARVV